MISTYFELTKPRIMALVLITAALGYFLGGQGIHDPLLLVEFLFGTACVAGGAGVMNHVLERTSIDAWSELAIDRYQPG